MKEKIILAYSGGLDTSIMIHWLKENYDCEVVCVCIDVGQGDDFSKLHEKAEKTGALKLYVEDLREEFVTQYIFPTLQAQAKYETRYLLGTSFARPLMAKRLVEIARKENAKMIAHGATGKGNDQVRFELTIMNLAPDIKIIAPWKDPKWTLQSREDCIEYAKERNVPIEQTSDKIFSEDGNIWHLSHEGGCLETLTNKAPDNIYKISTALESTPDKAEFLSLEFLNGVPTKIDDKEYTPVTLLEKLNQMAGKHGIGQLDLIENRLVGMKSRGVYETPGGTLLYEAHAKIESVVLDRDTLHIKNILSLEYAKLVYDGRWFTPLRESLDAFVKKTQTRVTGKVKIKLYKGNIVFESVECPHSLYLEGLASFSDDPLYDQKDAKGFINVYGLPMKVQGMIDKKQETT